MGKTIGVVLALKDQFTAPAKKATASTKAINQELKRTERQVKNMGKNLVKFAKIGVASATGIGLASIKMGMDFSESMAKVSTIADSTVVPIDNMRKEILALSNQTGISANAIADDVYNAISAGVDTAHAVETVAQASKLAKAGFTQSGDALDIMTTIVNGYNMSITEAEKVSDILITTQNKGKVTVDELSKSMGKIIPTANAMSVELEQVASGYAILTSNGIKSAEATTYMNAMLNELGKSGTKASNNLYDATGKTFNQMMEEGHSIGDVLAELDRHSQELELSMMDMFGSAEAGRASLVLASNAGEDFNNMMKEMEKSAGATQEAFDKLDDEPIEKLRKSTNRLKNQGIELGVMLLPVVNKIFDALLRVTDIPLTPYFEKVLGAGKSTYDFFKNNWSTIAPLLLTIAGAVAVYKVAMISKLAITKAVTIAEAIKNGVLATGAVSVNALTIAQWLLNKAMLANPIGLIIAGIAGIIAIVIICVNHFETIINVIKRLWDFLEPLRKVAKYIFFPMLKPLELIYKALDRIFNIGSKLEKLKFWKRGKKDVDEMETETNQEYSKEKQGVDDLPFEFQDDSDYSMDTYAKGGIANKPSIFGEAGAEIAIPLKKTPRSKSLLATANKIIGGDETVNQNVFSTSEQGRTETNYYSETKQTVNTDAQKKTTVKEEYIFNFYGDIYDEESFIEKFGNAFVQKIKSKMPRVVRG